MGGAAAGAGLGLLSGVLGNKKEGGTDAGSVWNTQTTGLQGHDFQNRIGEAIAGQQHLNTGAATSEMMSNPFYSQLFGQGGSLGRALGEEQDLSKNGFNMTNDDHSAFGEASGNIARMYDQKDQGLAQALAARGMDSSGAAAAAFAGNQGNKLEQLAGQQRQIANDRYSKNMERLGQVRQYATSLGAQGQSAIQNTFKNNMDANKQQIDTNMGWLNNQQNANETALGLRKSTEHQTDLSAGLNGAIGGAQSGLGGMGGSPGGMAASKGGGMNTMFSGSTRYIA